MAQAPKRVKRRELDAIASALNVLLQDQIGIKHNIEERMIEDIRQYQGLFPENERVPLQDKAKYGFSDKFMNLTRIKTDIATARIADILFPSTAKNFAIEPTPQPDIDLAQARPDLFAVAPEQAELLAQAAGLDKELARESAEAMERVIHDQLLESNYKAIARDALRDGCLYGTGIIKGPVIVNRTRKRWVESPQGRAQIIEQDNSPGVEYVSPFDFYPDMSASCMQDCEFVFQRALTSKKRMAELARSPGYDAKAIRQVIENGPLTSYADATGDSIVRRLLEMSDVYSYTDKMFERWCYTGPLDDDLLDLVGEGKGRDPLARVEVIVEFVGDVVIKALINPVESDTLNYSVWNYQPSAGSIFGYGVPWIMGDRQSELNKIWHAMLDNARGSVGPQLVVNKTLVKPADGKNYVMSPFKTWLLTDSARSVNDAFGLFDIKNTSEDLIALQSLLRQFIDEETGIRQLQAGEIPEIPQQTATAVMVAQKNYTTYLGLSVHQYDDNVTSPLIQRFFDFNMQFNDDQAIRGDNQVVAKGVSDLLEYENKANRVSQLLPLANDPVYGPMLDSYALLEQIIDAYRINPELVMRSEEEVERMRQAQMQQPSIPEQRLQLEAQKVAIDADDKQAQRSIDLLELAADQRKTAAQIAADLEKVDRQEATDLMEMQIKLETGSGI
jgi:hypothetical protein